MRKILITAFFILGSVGTGQCQTTTSTSISTSGAWLGLPSSVRADGLAGSYVAVSDDVGAMNINPAGLGQLKGDQMLLMHNGWIQGLIEEQARFSFNLGGGALAIGAGYLNGGDVDKISIVGGLPVLNGTFQPYAMRADLAYAMRLVKGWYAGISGTVAQENLDTEIQWSGIGNAGVLGELGLGFRTGLSVVNVGTSGGASTPGRWQVGASWQEDVIDETDFLSDKKSRLMLTAQYGSLFTDLAVNSIAVGGEFLYHQTVALRVGQQFGDFGNMSKVTGFTIGGGLMLQDMEIDYAFVTRGDLGNGSEFSFQTLF